MWERAAVMVKGFGLQPTVSTRCTVGIWPFEGRLLPQYWPLWTKMMGDMNQVSLAHNNCLFAGDTNITLLK